MGRISLIQAIFSIFRSLLSCLGEFDFQRGPAPTALAFLERYSAVAEPSARRFCDTMQINTVHAFNELLHPKG